MASLSEQCEQSMWSIVPRSTATPSAMRTTEERSKSTLDRGVAIRTICVASVRNNPDLLAHYLRLVEMGVQVRTMPTLPMRLNIIDRSVAVVAVDAEDSAAGAYVLQENTLVDAIAYLHLLLWREATPLTPARPRRKGDISSQERDALRLWAQGHTDLAVGRKLGVSERTVRRISETLGEKLGSQSRFQMAIRALEADWISLDDA